MKPLQKKIALAVVTLPLVSYSYLASGAEITNIGTLPGGTNSQANAVNAAGDVVVGSSDSTNGPRAYRWTQASGMVSLGVLAGGYFSQAFAVNATGDVVVGSSTSTGGYRAFRWTQASGMVNLGTLAGGTYSGAAGVNAAGDVVVGSSGSPTGEHAIRWTQASGMVDLGTLTGGTFSSATDVNAAGDVIVGRSDSSDGLRAFRWTQASGMVSLGVLAGGTYSRAAGVNGAGDVVVGTSQTATAEHAFRWTQASGMVSLGVLAGGDFSFANAVNAAGDVVVGQSTSSDGGYRAFRWTQAGGMQSVEQWLADHGVKVSGMNTEGAGGVNAKGDVVVGYLRNGNAYIARATADNSGMIDVQDFSRTLRASAYTQTLLTNNTDLVLNGLEGSPAHHPLPPQKMQLWVSGDGARLSHRDENGHAAAGELGLAYGITPALEGRLALGQQYLRNKTLYGGKTASQQSYLAPGLRYFLPNTSLVFGLSTYYGSGKVDIDRAYSNAGTIVLGQGSPDATSAAVRVRADWVNAYKLGPVAMTPYASLSYVRSKVDAYTESGKGFPVQWDTRRATAQLARVGNDGVWAINDRMSLLGRLEWTHRLNGDDDAVTGRIVGLNAFGFDAAKSQKDWLRVGLGGEYKVDASSSLKTMLNVTTQSNAPSFWMNVTYQKTF